jgi:predicted secreted protein
MLRIMLTCTLTALCVVVTAWAEAADTPRYNTAELQAEAQREVQNDRSVSAHRG